MIDVEGCLNFRDSGGWPTLDGGVTRTGLLYRADDSTRITDRGRVAVAALGLSRVVDLRQQVQFDRGAHFADMAHTFHCPLVDRVINLDDPKPLVNDADMADLYTEMLDRSVERFAAGLDTIADSLADGPVLIHCVYGKDRTGLMVAAIQLAIGVSRDDVVAEYARSDEPTKARYELMVAHPIPGDAPIAKAPKFLFNAPAPAMAILLDRLEQQHGSLEAWLQSLPVQPHTYARLRAALVDGGSAGE